MTDPAQQNDLEMRLLALLENETPSSAEWIALMEDGRRSGMTEASTEWAAMAQESLAKADDVDGGIDILKWRAGHAPVESMTGKDWVKAADLVAGSDPHLLALIQEAGFGQRLTARECVRRFRLLRNLKPGALCLHPTWGFGVVQQADPLYRKIAINFRGRPGHGLAMKAAAEGLELLPDDHLLARWHRDREAVQQQVKQDPAEVVRMALASFGPLPVSALQAKFLQSGVVAESDWKRFWDAARKVLKADPMVAIPAKRTEPIRLLDRAGGYDDAWYDRLATERNLKAILDAVRELIESTKGRPDLAPSHRAILGERLRFVMRGATSRQPGLKLIGAMLAARFQFTTAECDGSVVVRECLAPGALVSFLHDLPARDHRAVLDFLWDQDPNSTREALLSQLRHLHFTPLQEAVDLLMRQGAGDACRQAFLDACANRLIRQEMLLWILRHSEQRLTWNLPAPDALAPLVVEELEQDYMGDRLKTQKLLREAFEEADWLRGVFDGMTPGRQMDFFKRLNTSPAWPGLDRQVLQAKVIKLFPHLQSVITGEAQRAPVASYGTVTSQRTYRERQEQLEKLINIDIPANSKEIAVARSYGDLSENFEFKAAKEMQRVLMARRAELEAMITQVRPTDFSEVPKGVAGIGSTIALEYPDGHVDRFHILGEWDQQPEKHIISSSTRLAKAVAGKKPGDRVAISTEDGQQVECLLQSVEELPPDIQEWVK